MTEQKRFTPEQLEEFKQKWKAYTQARKEHSELYFTKGYKKPMGDIPQGGFNGA